ICSTLMHSLEIDFRTANSPELFAQARSLFIEYEQSLDFSIDFQDFKNELDTLQEQYAAPLGALILAYAGNRLLGCVALRKWEGEIAELKRMFIRPQYRGEGIGRQLLEYALWKSKDLGYVKLRLDTIN